MMPFRSCRAGARRLAFVSALFALAGGCVDDVEFGRTPELEFVSVSTTTLRSADIAGVSNELLITLNYADGDGDIGGNEPGLPPALTVVDTRPGFPYLVTNNVRIDSTVSNRNFNALQDRVSAITGQITIRLQSVTFVPSRNAIPPPFPLPTLQQVQYRIRLTDRAGNVSNTILTPPVTVRD